jgi:hypothetical protein
MTDEPNTSLDSGTDNVNPEQADTAENWTYFDPDEDTEEEPEAPATDDGTEEVASEEAEPEATEEAPATVEFTLQDGTKVDKDELVRGYQRQADYTRKTQEVATMRQTLSERTAEIDGIVTTVTEHLKTLMPKVPDESLAYSNPGLYVAQKANYEKAVKTIQELIDIGTKPKAVATAISADEKAAKFAAANQKLIAMFPEAGTQEGRPKFLKGVSETATALGFSMGELQQVDDHRVFALAHWAYIGMKAHAATKAVREKAKATPSPTKPGATAIQQNNVKAKERLARTGSIRDAMKVDFD